MKSRAITSSLEDLTFSQAVGCLIQPSPTICPPMSKFGGRPFTRKEAKAAGLSRYFTGKPCPNGHIAERSVSGYACIVCVAMWHDANSFAMMKNSKNWYKENKERANKSAALRYAACASELSCRRKQDRIENPNHFKVQDHKNYLRHKPYYIMRARMRKADVARAMPPWVDQAAILLVYNKAHNSDEPSHVDHIIPLNHKSICGLHVSWNLQVLPARKNCSKQNKFPYVIDGL